MFRLARLISRPTSRRTLPSEIRTTDIGCTRFPITPAGQLLRRVVFRVFLQVFTCCSFDCSAHGGHYYAYCRPNDGDDWVEFNDSAVRDDVEPVITKAAYILFFRRVNDCPRTLENLRAADARCREDGEWMKDALSASAESRGACVVDPGAASVYAPAPSPVRTSYHSSLSDGEQDRDEKRENHEFYFI